MGVNGQTRHARRIPVGNPRPARQALAHKASGLAGTLAGMASEVSDPAI
jgi:hypothetical protein